MMRAAFTGNPFALALRYNERSIGAIQISDPHVPGHERAARLLDRIGDLCAAEAWTNGADYVELETDCGLQLRGWYSCEHGRPHVVAVAVLFDRPTGRGRVETAAYPLPLAALSLQLIERLDEAVCDHARGRAADARAVARSEG